MASRQFKSTDTSKWLEKYGSGVDGVGSIDSSTFAEANETFAGTSGESTGTAGGISISDNDCVLIHQTQGTGAGNWELNKVTSGGGSANLTFKYALCNTYGTGAQILKLKQYSSLEVNSGQTWTGSTWNGSKGGFLAFLCSGETKITGTISGLVVGFRGGGYEGAGYGVGYRGEGTNGPAGANPYAADGNAGGGGEAEPGAGGGGGGGVDGGGGGQVSNYNNRHGGDGGGGIGNVSLTSMTLGGGGGGGGGLNNQAYGKGGGAGAGIVIIISKKITVTGAIQLTGQAGGADNKTSEEGGGGGGGGGNCLLKGQEISLGSNLINASGGSGGGIGSVSRDGGSGGSGRIHVDYLTSLAGTTTPTLDSTQDATIADTNGGSFLMNFI